MTLIEGFGDEVIEFFIGLLVLIVGAVAWWSTRIIDRPLIRTVLVLERRSRNQHTNLSTNQSTEERQTTDQRNYVQDLTTLPVENSEITDSEEKPPETRKTMSSSTTSNSQENRTSNSENEQRDIVETMDSEGSCELRRRVGLGFVEDRQNLLRNDVLPTNTELEVEEISDDVRCEIVDNVMESRQKNSSSRVDNTTNTTEDIIRIKLKYINDDLKLVNGRLQELLGDFKRRHFELELANNKLVRLIFNGQVLQKDDLSLQKCGLFDNCVVHCLIHQNKSNTNNYTSSTNLNTGSSSTTSFPLDSANSTRRVSNNNIREWDLGNVFFAIVSFVLGAAWYFRYEYAQLYTVTATVALVGLTGIFTVLLVGMYFPDPEPIVQSARP